MAPRAKREGRRAQQRRRQPHWWIYAAGAAGVAAAVVLIAITGGLTGGSDGDGAETPVVVPTPRPDDLAREGHLLGSAGAPVTIVEYADFQ